jgi:hypothetical protein
VGLGEVAVDDGVDVGLGAHCESLRVKLQLTMVER